MYLNYDQSDKTVFINSSIHQFAECLLLYVEMINKVNEVNGGDAYIDNDIPVSILAGLKNQFHRVDPKCIQPNHFWYEELEKLSE